MKPRFFICLTAILFTIVFSVRGANSLGSSDCSDYEFIFARGSGQKLDDVDYKIFKEKLNEKINSLDIKYDFYELGTADNGYSAYSPNDFGEILGTYVSAGASYQFSESVERGMEELLSRIRTETNRCRKKKFVLVGYSQGAFVIDRTLSYLDSNRVFYVASFGDPKLYLPAGKRVCNASYTGFSSYRVYVPDCEVEEGIFGGMKPYENYGFSGKRGAWCNKNDFVCGSGLNLFNIWGGHTTYIKENGYEKFADIIFEKIKKDISREILETDARYSDEKKRDVILVYDYMEQMGIWNSKGDSIRNNLKNRLVELANHGTRVAIYNIYTLGNIAKYLEEMVPFTNDNLAKKIDDFNRENSSWHNYIAGGGNNIYYAIKELSKNGKWSDGAERHIYVLANTINSDEIGYQQTNYIDAITAAKENNVKVSLLSENGLEKNMNYQAVVKETGGEIIGNDYSKIRLKKNSMKTQPKYFSKTFELNQNSSLTIVIINNLIYGFSDKSKITIKDLNENMDNEIIFVEYNSSGEKINRRIYNFSTKSPNIPDTGRS